MLDREFDVCIIGTGITGSLVADHFLSQGASVLMLERSKDVYLPANPTEYWKEEWQEIQKEPQYIIKNTWDTAEQHFDDLVSIENEHREFAFHYNMKYGLGGSGAVWSGASWRLAAEDFATQSHFAYGRDWPFSYEALSPYYARIEQLFNTSGPMQEPEWPWKNNYKYPAFKQSYLDKVVGRIFAPEYKVTPSPFSVKNIPPREGGCVGAKNCVRRCPANARFRPDTDILYKYLQDDKADLTLLMDAACIKLNLSKDRRIQNAEILHKGQAKTVKAKYFYLAANTIENLRILLNSADNHQGSVANANGLLGHYFASHGAIPMSITLNEPIYPRRGRPTTSSVINTLNHPQRERINSYMMEIWNLDWTIPATPGAIMRKLRIEEFDWGTTLFDKMKNAENRFVATYIFEIEMRKRNRVSLSTVKDKLGLPLAKVDFKLSTRDRESYHFLRTAAEQLTQKSGVDSVRIPGFGLNGNHPLGGYVSGNDPQTSVVDEWMRSHEHDNLYILGGGAFNSTSALNPTHTIAALALKALDDQRIQF
ncbi:MAG: hypothetical protein GQ582_09070 [Methyloprofundus sp.]|nr:hypothetical protein [Methyloprofundus sp.]